MATRLWEKGEDLNVLVHAFTVGNDPLLDKSLVYWDAQGSAAHARMLHSIGVLSEEELVSILNELAALSVEAQSESFEIPHELEDCHTAIEARLIEKTGDAGRKIHTGRSRNDQVLLCMRLYMRAQVVRTLVSLQGIADSLEKKIDSVGNCPMPGYTHFQPAMPTSVGMWLHAFYESVLSLLRDGLALLDILDENPLGAAAGFGSSLPLDRGLTSALLGFSRTQRSPIDIQNSRGRHELKFIRWCSDIGSCIEKFSWDMILYTTREFGFFSLPEALTTGSSIMPQKHNPDVVELLRARAARLRAYEEELRWVSAKLPSHYHRDLQYTKEPVLKASSHIEEMLPVWNEVIKQFSVNEGVLENAMNDELYATYDAYREVKAGKPFRDSYRRTASRVSEGQIKKTDLLGEFAFVEQEHRKEFKEAKKEQLFLAEKVSAWQTRLRRIEDTVFQAK